MKSSLIFLTLWVVILAEAGSLFAAKEDFSITGRELLERLTRLEEGQKLILQRFDDQREDMNKRFEQVDKRFEELREDMNKRFEQVDKRFEQVDKRFEEMDQRFEQMISLMMSIVGAFAAIVAVSIGFALWDRRTMIRPFETKVQQFEKDLARITPLEEGLAANRAQLKTLLEALRNLARSDTRLAEVLKSFALL